MPKVEAWFCPDSKKFFELDKEAEFKKHRAKILRAKRKQALENQQLATHEMWLNEARASISSLHELSEWFMKNYQRFVESSNFGRWYTAKSINRKIQIIEFKCSRIQYNGCASNTHSAPSGKVQNWQQLSDLPIGYPALIFECRYGYTPAIECSIAGILVRMGINPTAGTSGSFGSSTYHHTILWLDDWPGIKADVDAQLKEHSNLCIIATLKGVSLPKFSYNPDPIPF